MQIELLIGMIGSGKSTYACRRAKEGAMIVCHDDLVAMLHGGNPIGNGRGYEQELRDCYRRTEEDIACRILAAGRDVIIDRTHLTIESRQRWIDFRSRRHDTPWLVQPTIVAVVFPIETPEIHAARRFKSDPRGRSYQEWLTVAEHHARQAEAEPLSPNEGFSRVVFQNSMGRKCAKETGL